MAVTNLTNLTNTKGFYDVLKFVNDTTIGTFSIMFMIALFVIFLLMSMKKNSFEESILISSLFCTGFSILFVAMGLLNFSFIIIFGTIMAFAAYFVYKTKNYSIY